MYRVAGLYILAIVTGYFSLHVAVPALLGRSSFTSDLAPLHVLLAALISIIGWGVASAYSAWCNRRLRRVPEQEEATIRQRRAFYAGLLHHVTLIAATLTAVALIILTAVEYCRGLNVSPVRSAAGLLLAVFFGLSAATYRSRVQSYLSLIAVCLACYGFVGMFAVSRARSSMDGAALAVIALILGSISWLLSRFLPSSQTSDSGLCDGTGSHRVAAASVAFGWPGHRAVGRTARSSFDSPRFWRRRACRVRLGLCGARLDSQCFLCRGGGVAAWGPRRTGSSFFTRALA